LEKKEDIRRRILKFRREQPEEERKRRTDRIAETVMACRWFLNARDIYCYIDFDGEVGTRKIIEEAWRLRKNVWVPRISGMEMDFYNIMSFDGLEKNTFGILEPHKECPHKTECLPEEMKGLVIVPGVAFDEKRNRIGYGKGYYDRYLAAHPKLHTVAVAFELQIVERIEAEEQDVRLDMLVTERRVL